MEFIYLAIPLASLFGAIVAGFFGKQIGRSGAHCVTIIGVAVSFVLSLLVLKSVAFDGAAVYNQSVYTWMISDGIRFEVGFLVDGLTALMMAVVTGVSLMVHIYTIGYMHDDPGYQRFFSYISLFTFSMLMLVMSNNFLQLFFGWEAVGLVSYLLIGFWFKRETAIYANMKAFLVNRVGDFGFLLGIAVILMFTGSLDYYEVFERADNLVAASMQIIPGMDWSVITIACILLFIGAMGKSAQVPLHVWLPDSMEGPTPISALIHAATMVTAGIFMVARMSPLFELSDTALSFVIVIGATTAFFMGLVGIVQNDIKRVVAYSTLSQLGYMTVALGASAYSAAIFHLMTHAFFKALLFLAAGSVIIAMHHEQDIRKMGGLKKYLPITYWVSLVGSLALIGFPGSAGFFSKDAILIATHNSTVWGSGYAYFAVLSGVFITAFYSFRMFFLVFHGEERMDEHTREHLHEPPAVVTVPLILLAIPSAIIGWLTIDTVLFSDYFDQAIIVFSEHGAMEALAEEFHGPASFVLHGLAPGPTWLAAAGVISAWYIYLRKPGLAATIRARLEWLYQLLDNKYYFDRFNEIVFAGSARAIGQVLWRLGDALMIDGLIVNGSARLVGWFSGVARQVQTGYLNHYAFAMISGLILLLGWVVLG
ncbi:MAG: NADH-quinone oxidoreductase subunit L [Gammaproteobacteria bacterium]|jgi:NADH-quinone oxidoreductase subunit L|nr:NADH-quinone oxidoreductase subunit L [Gammaproteobacteria bacterium]